MQDTKPSPNRAVFQHPANNAEFSVRWYDPAASLFLPGVWLLIRGAIGPGLAFALSAALWLYLVWSATAPATTALGLPLWMFGANWLPGLICAFVTPPLLRMHWRAQGLTETYPANAPDPDIRKAALFALTLLIAAFEVWQLHRISEIMLDRREAAIMRGERF